MPSHSITSRKSHRVSRKSHRKSRRVSRKSHKSHPKISEGVKKAIKMKLNKSSKVANSVTVIEGRYKPSTFLKFSHSGPVLYVSIYKKSSVYRSGKHVRKSKYVGKFKAQDLL